MCVEPHPHLFTVATSLLHTLSPLSWTHRLIRVCSVNQYSKQSLSPLSLVFLSPCVFLSLSTTLFAFSCLTVASPSDVDPHGFAPATALSIVYCNQRKNARVGGGGRRGELVETDDAGLIVGRERE